VILIIFTPDFPEPPATGILPGKISTTTLANRQGCLLFRYNYKMREFLIASDRAY